ncbi:MAG: hypothetical protein HW416_62 [Chloroflexi bacterium]|nr:hypothetical protein [Chloroflexota bacterium]
MARTTIGMVAVFALLAVGVWVLQTTNPPAPANATIYVLDLKDSDVQRLVVTTAAGTTSFERAEPVGWKFAETGEQADLSRVSSVVNRLAKLRTSAKVGEGFADLSPYGMAPPVNVATLVMKDGSSPRIFIGSKTVNDASYYAMAEGGTTLYTVNTLVVGDLEKLVTDPPRPTPTPEGTATATTTLTPRPAAGTPEPTAVPTATIGLPSLSAP